MIVYKMMEAKLQISALHERRGDGEIRNPTNPTDSQRQSYEPANIVTVHWLNLHVSSSLNKEFLLLDGPNKTAKKQ